MHTEKVWIVILILVVVLVGSNLLMLAVARGMRGDGELFKNFGDFSKPWKKEDEGLRELSQRVKDLKAQDADENK